MNGAKTYEQLAAENEQLRWQLDEAIETLHAIRTGQIDALVVEGVNGHELYTLKTADHTYRVFIETMDEGAVTLNKSGLILYCNSTFASMVELPLSKVIGLNFGQFPAPGCEQEYASLFSQTLRESRKLEFTVRSNSGTLVPCQLSVTDLELDGGTCMSIILTDLTVQKKTQQLLKVNNEHLERTITALEVSNQALNRSNRNLLQFAYIASHDLQEPLRKIQQFSDLLKIRYATTTGEEFDYINRMQVAASRMSLLIKDLLAFSRISTGQAPVVPVSLAEVVDQAMENLSVAIEESNARIRVDTLPIVPGDASQLRQLFQNLLSNALKFSRTDPEGHQIAPQISIRSSDVVAANLPTSITPTGQAAAYYRIEVTDNGIGFEEKYLDRIFQVFQRLHGRTEFAGTGIGLAICEKVAANHGGGITAISQPGQGTTFQVYLPIS